MADRDDRRRAAAERERTARAEAAQESPRQAMYRGKPVRRPGIPPTGAKADEAAEFRAAIEELKILFRDGLITRVEAEAKRAELVKRFKA